MGSIPAQTDRQVFSTSPIKGAFVLPVRSVIYYAETDGNMQIITDHFTLLQGDSLQIMKDMRGMDLCLTDAPYLLTSGGATEGGLHERFGGGGVYDNGGNFFDGECPAWADFTPLIFDCLRDDAHYYSMADSKNQFEMQAQALAAGFRFHNLLYWDKGTCTPNRWYMKNAEFVGAKSLGLGR